jgi:hypothetical protein
MQGITMSNRIDYASVSPADYKGFGVRYLENSGLPKELICLV